MTQATLDLWEQREPPRRPNAKTSRARVLALLERGGWVRTATINDVGGSEGTRRLRELRRDGWTIERRRDPESNQWQYRLVTGAP